MHIKTILNRVQKFKSFEYEAERWVEDAPEPTIEVELRPRTNGRAICSGCGEQLEFRLQRPISRHNPALQPPNFCQISTHRDSVPVEANPNRLEIHRLGGSYVLNARDVPFFDWATARLCEHKHGIQRRAGGC